MKCINDFRRDFAPRGASKYVDSPLSRSFAVVKEVPPTYAAPIEIHSIALHFMLTALGIIWKF